MDVVKPEEVARRIRAGRETNNMRQADVAQITGLQQGLLSQWESGKIPQGACEVTAVGLAVGLRPDELYLQDVSSRARKDAGALSNEESDSLGRIVNHLRQLRDMGVPFKETEVFLAAFLRAPLSGTSESRQRPQPAEAVAEARRLLDSVLSDLPAESTHFAQIDSVSTLLEKIGATLPSANPQGVSSDRGASVPVGVQGIVPRPSDRKTRKGRK